MSPPQINSSKQGMWSSHFFRDLSQAVRRTPWDTPVTRTFLHPHFKGRRPTPKNTPPPKKMSFAQTVCANSFVCFLLIVKGKEAQFVQIVPKLFAQIVSNCPEIVCANCLCKLFLFGWVVFWGWVAFPSVLPRGQSTVSNTNSWSAACGREETKGRVWRMSGGH